MNDLVVLKNGTPTITSLKIAEILGKEHRHILRDVRTLIEKLPVESALSKSGQIFYKDAYGREQPMVEMTESGCLLLIMNYSSDMALDVKVRLIEAFESTRPAVVFSCDDVDRLRCSAIRAFNDLRLAINRYVNCKEGPEIALLLLPFVGIERGHALHDALRAHNRHETAVEWRRFAPMSRLGHHSLRNLKAPAPGYLFCDYPAGEKTEKLLTQI